MESVRVQHHKPVKQFEVEHDGLLAALQYDRAADRRILLYTEVPPALAGHGIGSALVCAALAYAREEGWRVVPRCPLVQIYLRRHPVDIPLVDPAFSWPPA